MLRALVEIKYLTHYRLSVWGQLAYRVDGDAGFDIRAAFATPVMLAPNDRVAVPTGICFSIPFGYELQLRTRPALARLNSAVVLSSPAGVGPSYRDEVFVLMANLGEKSFTIEPGALIAQGVIAPVVQATFSSVVEFDRSLVRSEGFE